jgi:glycosyltransferase involved in cell wall biosynthesis
MKVDQVLCAAGPVDAVTNQALACRRLFDGWGWEGADYAEVIAPTMHRHVVHPLRSLEPRSDGVLLVHYSGYAPAIEPLIGNGRRSLLLSHNITPAKYMWDEEPFEGVRCSLAPEQLAELARRADAVAGVSEFNAAELRASAGREDVEVIPVLFDRARLGPAPAADATRAAPHILFVGRLAPHKRQDLVIRAFGELRRHLPGARLTLVGVPISPAFEAGLRRFADSLAPGAVVFEHGIGDEELWERYRSADAFLCLSEHEGFCIPLLEAFHFGLPVIARDAGAIGEVVGDAGVLLSPSDDIHTIAELLRIVVADGDLRAELRVRAERRLAVYAHESTAGRLRERLTRLAA